MLNLHELRWLKKHNTTFFNVTNYTFYGIKILTIVIIWNLILTKNYNTIKYLFLC